MAFVGEGWREWIIGRWLEVGGCIIRCVAKCWPMIVAPSQTAKVTSHKLAEC